MRLGDVRGREDDEDGDVLWISPFTCRHSNVKFVKVPQSRQYIHQQWETSYNPLVPASSELSQPSSRQTSTILNHDAVGWGVPFSQARLRARLLRCIHGLDPENTGFIAVENFTSLVEDHELQLDPSKLDMLLALVQSNEDGQVCYQELIELRLMLELCRSRFSGTGSSLPWGKSGILSINYSPADVASSGNFHCDRGQAANAHFGGASPACQRRQSGVTAMLSRVSGGDTFFHLVQCAVERERGVESRQPGSASPRLSPCNRPYAPSLPIRAAGPPVNELRMVDLAPLTRLIRRSHYTSREAAMSFKVAVMRNPCTGVCRRRFTL
ncbi:unnamed protein product [Pleuronectes platessa]|uniref:EF-hand domain-containing protein n=1 Tax=Pleuronectes platessa TaxID=8262 RepID=A0A9N7VLF1_PLEPL|nr:unnamed protein product [Pleuronectes platessa]